MNKALSLFLALVLCLSLCACGGEKETKATLKDYSGKWVQEERVNSDTGAVENITLNLYEDGTYKEEMDSFYGQLGEHEVLNLGDWEIKGDVIILKPFKVDAEDGNLKEIATDKVKLKIIDKKTLKNGSLTYTKELN